MRIKNCLAAADVKILVAACKKECERNGWAATIAVVDEGGFLLYLERMDGPGPMSCEVAIGKARTAALTRQPSNVSEERIRNRPGMLQVAGHLPLQGGMPVMWQGACVGGIGISGAPSPQIDEQIAAAGAAASSELK